MWPEPETGCEVYDQPPGFGPHWGRVRLTRKGFLTHHLCPSSGLRYVEVESLWPAGVVPFRVVLQVAPLGRAVTGLAADEGVEELFLDALLLSEEDDDRFESELLCCCCFCCCLHLARRFLNHTCNTAAKKHFKFSLYNARQNS